MSLMLITSIPSRPGRDTTLDPLQHIGLDGFPWPQQGRLKEEGNQGPIGGPCYHPPVLPYSFKTPSPQSSITQFPCKKVSSLSKHPLEMILPRSKFNPLESDSEISLNSLQELAEEQWLQKLSTKVKALCESPELASPTPTLPPAPVQLPKELRFLERLATFPRPVKTAWGWGWQTMMEGPSCSLHYPIHSAAAVVA